MEEEVEEGTTVLIVGLLEEDRSQTTHHRWYNGCDIGNHDTREEDAWRWRGQAQAT